ncbi:hypothetical protein TNCT_372051 [Trichonephila clavata]|uniref:DUF5641 domain-containing protein n=1 Tax=Trichonephila clavata TaxID=2740835 RepID=A0A8X6KZG9_TRICU|nr:hypothetical protein TNCT_372051 [Trichonephila clavata]
MVRPSVESMENLCVILSQDLRKRNFPLGKLLSFDQSERLNWPLGRVIELYPGKDGIERGAKLRVANDFVIRVLQRLHSLQMSVSDLPSRIVLRENFPKPKKDLTD